MHDLFAMLNRTPCVRPPLLRCSASHRVAVCLVALCAWACNGGQSGADTDAGAQGTDGAVDGRDSGPGIDDAAAPRDDGGVVIADDGAVAVDDGGTPPGDAGMPVDFEARCARPGVVFCDSFESGDLSYRRGDARWGSATRIAVGMDRAVSGSHSARFRFVGTTTRTAMDDAFSELRFDAGALMEHMWLEFSLYVPMNYEHRDAESSDNNKLLRFWGTTYNDREKVGYSLWPTGPGDDGSTMIADWVRRGETGIGPRGGRHPDFLSAVDQGTWVNIRVELLAATSSSPGALRLWKNGVLVADDVVDNFRADEAHAYRYGYLLGWSNSGFDEDTDFYIDDVVISSAAL